MFTGRGAEAKRFCHEVDAGNLGVNTGTATPMAFFGDLHTQDEDMIHFYTDEAVYIER